MLRRDQPDFFRSSLTSLFGERFLFSENFSALLSPKNLGKHRRRRRFSTPGPGVDCQDEFLVVVMPKCGDGNRNRKQNDKNVDKVAPLVAEKSVEAVTELTERGEILNNSFYL